MKRIWIILSLLGLLAGCGESSVDETPGQGYLSFDIDWSRVNGSISDPTAERAARISLNGIPADVAFVRASISADGETITRTFNYADHGGVLPGVLAGSNRSITVQGLNAAQAVRYAGSLNGVTVARDQTTFAGTVVMQSVNQAPTADAGGDQSVSDGATVTLSGDGSDADGQVTAYQWTQISGTTVALSGATNATAGFTAPSVSSSETLTFRLTVTDNDSATATDDISIRVNPIVVLSSNNFPLNDTGLDWGGNYPSGNNATCIGETITEQDCAQGRDARAAAGTLAKTGAGHAGFDFTKLDGGGNALPASAASWACVHDNHTGLTWEVKSPAGSGGIHDAANTYRWGGKTAQLVGDFGTRFADWDTLVDGTNSQNLCGFTDWRVPTQEELRSIVSYDRASPAVDTDYFPNTVSSLYWSAIPSPSASSTARNVDFVVGTDYAHHSATFNCRVRLVRAE